MNIFKEIGALLKVKNFVETEAKEAKQMNGQTPGYKTTEFWLTLLTNVITVVGSLKGLIPDQAAAIIIASANGLYGVLRTLTKTVPATGSNG